ncbi:MAG: hypothetical protein H0U56_15525 [Methylibium sp.]|nr:hypothetical protein [Methylibium sp.]
MIYLIYRTDGAFSSGPYSSMAAAEAFLAKLGYGAEDNLRLRCGLVVRKFRAVL